MNALHSLAQFGKRGPGSQPDLPNQQILTMPFAECVGRNKRSALRHLMGGFTQTEWFGDWPRSGAIERLR